MPPLSSARPGVASLVALSLLLPFLPRSAAAGAERPSDSISMPAVGAGIAPEQPDGTGGEKKDAGKKEDQKKEPPPGEKPPRPEGTRPEKPQPEMPQPEM